MDEIYEVAFGLILHAGNSRSFSIKAVQQAEKGFFEKAKELIKEAENEMHLAHDIQTKLLQGEAAGNKTELNLLMIHAQDHLSMALIQRDTSQQIIKLYERLENKND